MPNKTINLSDEALIVWEKRFSDTTTGFGEFSTWVSNKLIELDEEKYDLPTLIKMQDDLNLDIEQKKERAKIIKNKIVTAEKLEELKYTLTDDEKEWLKETKDLIKIDPTKLKPRMNYYSNTFNKDINVEEFFKLLELAK